MCHTLKFIYFINKNNDIPFNVKFKVFEAALMSTLLYGCESWLSGDIKPVNKQYMWCIKQLLGVRKTTCNDLCLMELGCPPLQALVKSQQRKFFSSMWRERSGLADDPLAHAIRVTLDHTSLTSRYVHDLIHAGIADIFVAYEEMKERSRLSESGRVQLYIIINPHYVVLLGPNIPFHSGRWVHKALHPYWTERHLLLLYLAWGGWAPCYHGMLAT